MRLVKDGDVFVSSNENVISAYLDSGWAQEEAKQPQKEAQTEAPKTVKAKK